MPFLGRVVHGQNVGDVVGRQLLYVFGVSVAADVEAGQHLSVSENGVTFL